MRLDAATADRLFHHLIDRQVIAPTASGVARAIQPLNTRCVTNEARHARQVLRFARDLHDRLRRMASSRADAQGEGDIPSHEDAHPNPPNDDLSHSP